MFACCWMWAPFLVALLSLNQCSVITFLDQNLQHQFKMSIFGYIQIISRTESTTESFKILEYNQASYFLSLISETEERG